jgi:hypothetical protein
VPGHLQKCTKRAKPQVNALLVNDLGVELTYETLTQLEIGDALTAEMDQLSLNALSGTDAGDSMRVRALVQDKIMLILVDSGSYHSFVSSSFLLQTKIIPQEVQSMQVRVANGGTILSSQKVFPVKTHRGAVSQQHEEPGSPRCRRWSPVTSELRPA